MSVALYRKHRPRLFRDIIGQEEITTPIKNQVISDNLSHAYLFCGTRGTGKTTTAKVYAKAVNCLSPQNGEPCLECEACESSTLDIVEIDAATNNGVDDVRQLNERVQYTPSKLKYLVVIIDEVHMFSKGAFNALLKTLEEPPSHVKFILATTEPQKIPATIRSRCQIYHFNRITSKHSVSRLQYVCKEEGIEANVDALQLIASNSDGAMRDALSILDQLTSISKNITREMVENRLGIMNQKILMELVDGIIIKDVTSTLTIYRLMIDKGQDVRELVHQVLNTTRDLLVYSSSKDVGNIEGLDEYVSWIKETHSKTSKTFLSVILNSLSELYNKLSYTLNPTTVGENEFIKLCSPLVGRDIDSLIEKIDGLERELQEIKKSGKVIERSKEVKVVHIQNAQKITDETTDTLDCFEEEDQDIEEGIEEINENISKQVDEESNDDLEPKQDDVQVTEKLVDEKVDEEIEKPTEEVISFDLNAFSTNTKNVLNSSKIEQDGVNIRVICNIPVYEIVFNTFCKKELEEAGYVVDFVLAV